MWMIVVAGWMYVVVLMAGATWMESPLGALGILVFYGIVPSGLIAYIWTAKERRFRREQRERQAAALEQPEVSQASGSDSSEHR